MKIYVFGNEDLSEDNSAIAAAKKIASSMSEVEFIFIKPNENLPFDEGQDVVIMDSVEGLLEVALIENETVDKIILAPRTTAHDFDLGFQLKYLKKLGKLGRVTIIGLPMSGKVDYNLIHSILRKLVAQDIQGS